MAAKRSRLSTAGGHVRLGVSPNDLQRALINQEMAKPPFRAAA
jgi:hypothetical protein